jgi:glucokinase
VALASRAVGIDVGASKVALGLVDCSTGQVERLESFATSGEGGSTAVLDACRQLCERLAQGAPVAAIGVALCEIVDPAGAIKSACSIDWRDLDVIGALSHIAPTYLESDVRAAAIGEARYGAGQDLASFLYVNAGSGISSCLVIDGMPLVGLRGAAILMGAGPLEAEATAGGLGIAQLFGAPTAEDVSRASRAGNTHASEILHSGGSALGEAIAFSVNLLDPEAVLLGGGVGLNDGIYRVALETSMRCHIWLEETRDHLPLLDAVLGEHAGVVGAARTALDHAPVGRA